ncbi:hypothetical protein GCM10009422_15580 [Brevundimonas kwangchunensis]|uniref:Lipoprotein n=1 Tax=Brevundimonas kwangchunensis TaxID=322163 RepID=A0ABP3RY77_9CAUL
MKTTTRLPLVAVLILGALTSCSPSTRIALKNDTGAEIETAIGQAPTRLAAGETSRPFILAWGAQGHWSKTVTAGGCTWTWADDDYGRDLRLPPPTLTQPPTLLVIDSAFNLTALNENGDALGQLRPRRSCP